MHLSNWALIAYALVVVVWAQMFYRLMKRRAAVEENYNKSLKYLQRSEELDRLSEKRFLELEKIYAAIGKLPADTRLADIAPGVLIGLDTQDSAKFLLALRTDKNPNKEPS